MVRNPEEMAEILRNWSSVFTACSSISNRISPLHRDAQTSVNWYDILATVGTYSGAVMEFPGVGIRLEYSPGTVVGISGKIVRHGVSDWDEGGERVCLASYLRTNVFRRLGVGMPHWSNWNRILAEVKE